MSKCQNVTSEKLVSQHCIECINKMCTRFKDGTTGESETIEQYYSLIYIVTIVKEDNHLFLWRNLCKKIWRHISMQRVKDITEIQTHDTIQYRHNTDTSDIEGWTSSVSPLPRRVLSERQQKHFFFAERWKTWRAREICNA